MLIDSGSSTSFLNQALAPLFPVTTTTFAPVKVKVANGAELLCSTENSRLCLDHCRT